MALFLAQANYFSACPRINITQIHGQAFFQRKVEFRFVIDGNERFHMKGFRYITEILRKILTTLTQACLK